MLGDVVGRSRRAEGVTERPVASPLTRLSVPSGMSDAAGCSLAATVHPRAQEPRQHAGSVQGQDDEAQAVSEREPGRLAPGGWGNGSRGAVSVSCRACSPAWRRKVDAPRQEQLADASRGRGLERARAGRRGPSTGPTGLERGSPRMSPDTIRLGSNAGTVSSGDEVVPRTRPHTRDPPAGGWCACFPSHPVSVLDKPRALTGGLRYLVRPNQGYVAPGTRLPVSILLLAQDKT